MKDCTFHLDSGEVILSQRLSITIYDYLDELCTLTVVPIIELVGGAKIGGEVLTGGLLKSFLGFCPNRFIAVFNKKHNGGSIRFLE